MFEHATVRRVLEAIPVLGPDHAPAADVEHCKARRADGGRPIVGDIQVQVPVAIDIGQGAGHGAVTTTEPAVGRFAEHTVAVVQ